jgi:hypothetical protein
MDGFRGGAGRHPPAAGRLMAGEFLQVRQSHVTSALGGVVAEVREDRVPQAGVIRGTRVRSLTVATILAPEEEARQGRAGAVPEKMLETLETIRA